jgi:hypothetical protein
MNEWLHNTNYWVLYAVTVAILVGAAELGAALARWHRVPRTSEMDRFVATLAAPAVGILALMIGFTFAMSLSRFEDRVSELAEEANAIEKAALRGRLLAEPHRSAVAPLFKEYVRARIAPLGEDIDSPAMKARIHRSRQIQETLWREATAAAESNPQVVPTGMFVEALNGMIDAYGRRIAARRNRVPPAIFVVLEAIAIVAIGFSGYGAHGTDTHRRTAMWIMAVMIGIVIALIVDLDTPQRGLVTVSQKPLFDLIDTMN